MDLAIINIEDISPLSHKINMDYFISVKSWESRELKIDEIPT